MENLFLALLGLISGIASALFGIGGGTLIVPSLLLVGFNITSAIGISVVQMIFASFFGTYLNYRKNLIQIDLGIALGIGGVLGSSLSGLILAFTPEKILHITFLIFTLVSFIKYFFSSQKDYTLKHQKQKYLALIGFGILVGIFSSSLGVGGGLLLAPLLGLFLGFNSKQVVPLALFFICFSSSAGAISLYIAGFIHFQQGCLVGIFAMIGVFLGILFLQKLSPQSHKKALLLIYIFSIGSTLFKMF